MRCTEAYASDTTASSASLVLRPSAAQAEATCAVSYSTVRMVPSTGLRTAWNATSTARLNDAAIDPASKRSQSSLPSQRPRRICEVMTPELPRAPMSAPDTMAFLTSARPASAGSAFRPATTLSSVSDMFVPVSPSGTGKTLSLLISSLRLESSAEAWAIALTMSVDE